ncbi:MAG: hypothetical protein P9X22_01070 [Candidatus Zapsychrus exili]|nr:hypothetical protein [Candidatus Zapsychrus exili]
MAEEQKEIGKNCGACKKALSRAKRYYRNNDYYCNSNCYEKKMESLKANPEE